jgi:hypothetical protein
MQNKKPLSNSSGHSNVGKVGLGGSDSQKDRHLLTKKIYCAMLKNEISRFEASELTPEGFNGI